MVELAGVEGERVAGKGESKTLSLFTYGEKQLHLHLSGSRATGS
jgi:hypothetical protein